MGLPTIQSTRWREFKTPHPDSYHANMPQFPSFKWDDTYIGFRSFFTGFVLRWSFGLLNLLTIWHPIICLVCCQREGSKYHLHSGSSIHFIVFRLNTSFGELAMLEWRFLACWILFQLIIDSSISILKTRLKTYLLRQAFNEKFSFYFCLHLVLILSYVSFFFLSDKLFFLTVALYNF